MDSSDGIDRGEIGGTEMTFKEMRSSFVLESVPKKKITKKEDVVYVW